MTIADEDQTQVGHRLRALRLKRGLSLQQVASMTDISRSFLALVEAGNSDVSFGRLRKLLWAYGAELSDLVASPDDDTNIVVSQDALRHLHMLAPGINSYLAGPSTQADLLATIATLEPGSGQSEPSQHYGAEVLHILEGKIDLYVDEHSNALRLSVGDTAYIASERLHRISNEYAEKARLMSVAVQPRLGDNARPLH